MADIWDDAWFVFLADAMVEARKAMQKFPQPNYVITKVAEEAGEVVKAAVHCAEGRESAENLRSEMKQLIAMLYRLWVEGDQVHGLQPLRLLLTTTAEPCGECHLQPGETCDICGRKNLA
jgi:phosphoribosyl-ATP pyrophosphohydrolase